MFYVKDGLNQASFYKKEKSKNITQKFQQLSITLPRKYKFFTLYLSATPTVCIEPTLCSKQTEMLTIPQTTFLNFCFLFYTVHPPQNALILSSVFKKSHSFFRLNSKATFCIKSFQIPHIPMIFHGTLLIYFMWQRLHCLVI